MDLLTERIFAKWSTPAMKNYVHLVCKSLSTELLEWLVRSIKYVVLTSTLHAPNVSHCNHFTFFKTR